jgi:hypothetical protein
MLVISVVIICVVCLLAPVEVAATVRHKLGRLHHKHGELPMPHSTFELGHIPRYSHGRSLAGPEIVPVYPGYGTHFAYIYVGTPPQRQSVIIDTGSHYTAFPCTGCSQCGQHTDNYWNPDNSTTAKVDTSCNGNRCTITQSYSEGSSWHAFKVVDKLWVGGLNPSEVPNANSMAIDFAFGCQTSETGLFRTQLADGIMGFAMHDDTLPYKLVENKLTDSLMFALCFRVGGGIMTVGGVDPRIHLKTATVQYTNMTSSNGWFAIDLIDILIQKQNTLEEPESLGGTPQQYCGGKGCIVDSGTTDTYLPASLSKRFSELFFKTSDVHYSSANVILTQEQLNSMPNLIFVFRGSDGALVKVEMPWTSYVDSVGGGKYAFRLYLSESSGTVLGANFMNGHNVIFDVNGKRVGFARSNCKYEDYALTLPPTAAPTKAPVDAGNNEGDDASGKPEDCEGFIATSACSAHCDIESGFYVQTGNQTFIRKCTEQTPEFKDVECHVPCNGHRLSRRNPSCTDSQWTECSRSCKQFRSVADSASSTTKASQKITLRSDGKVNYDRRRRLDSAAACVNHTVDRSCYTGSCPIKDGDYYILLDMLVGIDPYHWSFVHEENFFGAISSMFGVRYFRTYYTLC